MVAAPLRVLLVEDNPGDVRLVREMLADATAGGVTLESAATLAAGLARLARGGIDAVLLDLGLPDGQGLDTFRRLHARVPEVPAIVLTGNDDVDLAIAAVAAGAQDYLVKSDLAATPLVRALQYAVARRRSEDELRAAAQALAAANADLRAQVARREAAEEEVRRLNAELEERVRQRTAQLEATNRELEGFSYSVSHDLRSPLRAIEGFSSILAESGGELSPRGRDCVQRICGAARRMSLLIDDLLALSRIGRQDLRLADADLSRLGREIVAELREAEPTREVEVVIPDGIRARGDVPLLRIVLQNLLANAWKFTSRRPHARIELGVEPRTEGPAWFVRDDGAGFDPRFAERLFQPFQRLHRSDEFEGSGIGLAIVHRVVTRHGGSVWADAAVGCGATFFFTLG